jgi:ADP-ribosylglycohydrolase
MALAVKDVLSAKRAIDQDLLSERLAERYRREPARVYNRVTRKALGDLGLGCSWRDVSRQFFGGQGSMGNSAAPRAALIGAYFADSLQDAAENAQLSAEITHAHLEGQAGAMAVAAATAQACHIEKETDPERGRTLLEAAIAFTPDSVTRKQLMRARKLWRCDDLGFVIPRLGNGFWRQAPDTVPFALWCAAKHVDDYRDALWQMARGLGDLITNGAIVGGVLAMAVGVQGLPFCYVGACEKGTLR